MKKNPVILLVLVSGLLLSGCGNDLSKERIITRDILCLNDDGDAIEKLGTIDLLYKANADIPYISLEEGMNLVNTVRSELVSKDYVLTLKQEGDKA